jgi:transposase
MASIAIELNFPPEIKVLSYEFHQGAHAFEVDWPLPECHRCERCSHEQRLVLEYKDHALVIRDLDLWGEPSFWVYQVVFHRCEKCAHRQHLLPPFKRKDVTYTYRFEQHVLRMMIGSNEEEVARRLGVSAETVRRIVLNQLADAKDKQIDPSRKISDVGLDEISLKKRHKLYVTLMTDLSDPRNPEILAMAKGKDEAAGNACLLKLSAEQRSAVRTYRVDMGAAYNKAGKTLLLKAKAVIDRFHVAKKFGEAVDAERKKITQAYRANLTAKERKEFKALMWEFRRAPEDLSSEQKAKLEALFVKLPQLRKLHEAKVRFKLIFDSAANRKEAASKLRALRMQVLADGLDLEKFFVTYEDWRKEILNYFDERQTSAAVEGINNKARVITKRAYGLKSVDSLWTRMILDLNRAEEAVGHTITQIKGMVNAFRAIFKPYCT